MLKYNFYFFALQLLKAHSFIRNKIRLLQKLSYNMGLFAEYQTIIKMETLTEFAFKIKRF